MSESLSTAFLRCVSSEWPGETVYVFVQAPLSYRCSYNRFVCLINWHEGAQWLSGRVLDSRPRGRGLEPHRRHCVVILEQDTFIIA